MRIKGFAAHVAVWSARHRALAIIGWIMLVAGITILSGQIGAREASDADFAMGESGRGDAMIRAAGFPERSGEVVLIQGAAGEMPPAAADVATALRATGLATAISDPLPSADGGSLLISFTITDDERVREVIDAVDAVGKRYPNLYVSEIGDASGPELIGEEMDRSLSRLSLLSLPLTIGILLVAFGAVVAAFVPVALAITAVIAAFGLLALTSRLAPTVDATMHVMLLVGLAVGVDYCLFYVRREREERAKGADRHRALVVAAQTSGRSIWISGLTVIIAMSSMLFTGDATFVSFGVGTMLVVTTAVVGSLTVLPALLSLLGDRVDAIKIPGLYRRHSDGRMWGAILRVVLHRPLASALLATALLGLLAMPTLRLHIVPESLNDFTADVPAVATVKKVKQSYPGGLEPAKVVVRTANATDPAITTAIEDFKRRALATGQIKEPFAVEISPDRTVAVISVSLAGTGTDAATEQALATLRESLAPSLAAATGAEVAVTGDAAESRDFNQALKRSMPLVFIFVLGLTFLLMLVSFRSIVIAATTIVLNLLSVAAAYGMLVVVFQDGWGEGVLNFTSNGGIVNWLPLFLFVVLFGLSMDYHVFVLSRIREGHDRGLPTREAITRGIAGTAGVITSAAVVMVAVFSLFTTIPLVTLKQAGFGLAAAVLLDATVIRGVLLPAVMALLGEKNWYLPRWLNWLPEIKPETDVEPEPAKELQTV